MPIASLYFTDVGPFEEIEFEFNDRVNVFTGPNNSGKSTVLWVMGELLVYPFTLPLKMLRSDNAKWKFDFGSASDFRDIEGHFPSDASHLRSAYEVIGYTCFIPAQRQGTSFRPTGPTVGEDIESRLDEELEMLVRERPRTLTDFGTEAVRRRMRDSQALEDSVLAKRRKLMPAGTSLVTDKAVIQKIVDLDYAAYRKGEPRFKNIVNKIFSIAAEITEGFPIEFKGIGEVHDEAGLFLELDTPGGRLPFDVLSQGTQSIVHCLARFLLGYAEFYEFPENLEDKPGILIIDEIDAHLHPSWQRRILPTLTKHFPNLQIFCSTHSPLMLAGLNAGQVQLLRRDDEGKVTVSTNDRDVLGWSADEILRGFLEVPSPTDLETVCNLEKLDRLERKDELTAHETEELERLRQLVNRDLLNGPVSGLLERFTEDLKRATS